MFSNRILKMSSRFLYSKDQKSFNNYIRFSGLCSQTKFSRRDFVKLMGAGSLFVGLNALGIPNIIKNIREASALHGVSAREQMQQIQLMLLDQV